MIDDFSFSPDRLAMEIKINNTRLMYLYEAQRFKTMNAASEAMDVAPSSVTRQIAALEKELGVPLIEKGRRGIKLTEAGILARDHYLERCAQEEVFLSKIDNLKSLKTGTIKIAIGEGFVSDAFSRLINHYIEEYPGISVDILLAKTNHIMELVKEDEIHFGLIFDIPRDPKIRTKLELSQPIRVVMSPNHPLAMQDMVSLTEASQHKMTLPNKSYRIRQIVDMAETFLDPDLTSNSLLLIKDYVKSGKGISFMPQIAAQKEILGQELVSRPTDSGLFEGTKISMISRLGRQLPDSADLLLRRIQLYLKETVAALTAVDNRVA